MSGVDPLKAAARAELARVYGSTTTEWPGDGQMTPTLQLMAVEAERRRWCALKELVELVGQEPIPGMEVA